MKARILHGDWLTLARDLPRASIDLLYCDPPFNTGVTKRTPPRAGRVNGRTASAAFQDTMGTPTGFALWLRERLEVTLHALKPASNLLIHVDWRTSHHVRLMLDDMLGEDRFVNHLIWSYGLGGSSPRRFARKHDDILYYSLDPSRCFFQPPRVPATSRRLAGQSKKMTDVLTIPSINNMAAERTGYPTQKPLALMELLVGACCPPGSEDGTVLDPTCGSGTTLVAATRLGRSAIGFDRLKVAVLTARRRVASGS